jgi:hypothetical protein
MMGKSPAYRRDRAEIAQKMLQKCALLSMWVIAIYERLFIIESREIIMTKPKGA